MESRHASLGRRTLEDIRQKRAAERLSKVSSGSEIPASVPNVAMVRSESGNVLYEKDVSGLLSQIKDLERKNAVLEEENKDLLSKLQKKEVESDTLQKRVNELEQTIPSLRKALRDVAMEKDAAVIGREDLAAQLRIVKKRLKEAEEEQYRTEEDAAALRAELNSVHQQAMKNPLSGIPSMSNSLDMQALGKELSNLKSELQQESLLRQQERQRLAEEQARASSLTVEKQQLEERLVALLKKESEAVDVAASKEFSMVQAMHFAYTYALFMETGPTCNMSRDMGKEKGVREQQSFHWSGYFGYSGSYLVLGIYRQEKEKLEIQLHEMAVMVERLENSRQKLLMEIDSQSSEIERLFEENSNLSASYEDAVTVVSKWENQVKDCLKQNEELRIMLDQIRSEQANMLPLNIEKVQSGLREDEKDDGNTSDPRAHTADILFLKGQLAKEHSRVEGLSAEVMKLSAQLQHSVQAYNGLARLYKPVLRNIESNLLKMKNDGSVAVQ